MRRECKSAFLRASNSSKDIPPGPEGPAGRNSSFLAREAYISSHMPSRSGSSSSVCLSSRLSFTTPDVSLFVTKAHPCLCV